MERLTLDVANRPGESRTTAGDVFIDRYDNSQTRDMRNTMPNWTVTGSDNAAETMCERPTFAIGGKCWPWQPGDELLYLLE